MKKLFEQLKGTILVRGGKTWYLAGYNNGHFIVARNTRNAFLKKEIEPVFLLPEFDVHGCRYEYASEEELLSGYNY